MHMNTKKRIACALLICAAGIGIAGLQCGLTVRRYTVQSGKLAAGKQLRIAMLSDLHSYVYGNDQSPLLKKVADEQPDLILLCGDMVDDKKPQQGAQMLLEHIADIAPCYYVSGNHEFWSEDPEGIFDMVQSCGIHVLRGTREEITVDSVDYVICGVDDPAGSGDRRPRSYGNRAAYQRALEAFSDLPQDNFNILLAHRPEYIAEYARQPFDLVLSGHAHGGQWRIPYLMNGLIAPNQGWLPKYAGGQYRCGDMTEIVGRGLVLNWKPRLFNPPEIVVVDIVSQSGEV